MENKAPPVGEVIRTQTEEIWLGNEGIIRYSVISDRAQTLEDAKENIAAGKKISLGIRRPCLIDLRGCKAVNREARNYYTGNESESFTLAAALLVESPVSRVLGNFFMGFNRPHSIPTSLFTSESEAILWLSSFQKK